MIFFECCADEVLVRNITNISKRELVHAGNKAAVCKKLQKTGNSKGLVDEDPGSTHPRYIQRLQPGEDLSRHDLKILHDNPNDNAVIVLCPRLEEWILKAAGEAGIDVREYGLPDRENKLHAVINTDLRKFERVLGELKERNSERLERLAGLLRG